MKNFEVKNTEPDSVKDVDTVTRRVKVVISKMGVLDLDNDVIDTTAYNKTIKERGPKAANLIWHLTDHIPSLKNAIGKFSELSVEKDNLIGVTDIPKTTWGNDVLEFYQTGNINQHSVGFRTVKDEPVNAGKANEHRLIKEILLYEGSAVLWGANPETPTLSVGKSYNFNDQEELKKEYLNILLEINNFTKLFKTGHLSDQSFELMEIRVIQQTDKLKQLFEIITQPALKAVEPKTESSVLSVLQTFNNSFNSTQNDPRRKEGAGGFAAAT